MDAPVVNYQNGGLATCLNRVATSAFGRKRTLKTTYICLPERPLWRKADTHKNKKKREEIGRVEC